jgi:hypothetical protein
MVTYQDLMQHDRLQAVYSRPPEKTLWAMRSVYSLYVIKVGKRKSQVRSSYCPRSVVRTIWSELPCPKGHGFMAHCA